MVLLVGSGIIKVSDGNAITPECKGITVNVRSKVFEESKHRPLVGPLTIQHDLL